MSEHLKEAKNRLRQSWEESDKELEVDHLRVALWAIINHLEAQQSLPPHRHQYQAEPSRWTQVTDDAQPIPESREETDRATLVAETERLLRQMRPQEETPQLAGGMNVPASHLQPETPWSGHTSPESVTANPADSTTSTPETVTSVPINGTWPPGQVSAEPDFPTWRPRKNRTTAPTSFTRAEEASPGRSANTDEIHAVVLKELRQKIDDGLVPEENAVDRGYNLGLRQVRAWIHRLYRDAPDSSPEAQKQADQ